MESKLKLSLFSIIFIINFVTISSFDFDFNDLIQFLDNEKSILNTFDKYLSSEENRIFRLRQTYERFRQQNSIALKDKELFLSHPNDVYLLIKRITIEWKAVEESLEPIKQITNEFRAAILGINETKYNFTVAVKGYDYLIYYFEQNITSAANGILKYETNYGEQKVFKSLSNQTFDAFDCLTIGKQSLNNEDYGYAYKWLKEGLNRVDSQTSPQINDELLENFSAVRQKLLEPEVENEGKPLNDTERQTQRRLELIERNDNLCLGRKYMNISYKSKLKCFYLNTTLKPFLRLTRVRVEELSKSPQFVLIHNFLSESEAQSIKNLTEPTLGHRTNRTVRGQRRIASSNLTKDMATEQRISLTFNRRMAAITGQEVNMLTEKTNVVRYFVGGHFDMHPDFSPGRIVSFITYLSDVAAGGATTMPRLNITVFPQKYASFLFYNVRKSGEMVHDILHTGCPVLYGKKWITITGTREWDQTHDKCALNQQEYYSIETN